ncbi:MAG TPA: BatA domain-containing protein [Phycisphaerae bacterium]|nr:BatA domain-containing protein [Phycisphaerae bacterium]HRR85523.1 BatA domain-containing protein [Phycisphaerae bacterium]
MRFIEFANPHALWLVLLVPLYLFVLRRRPVTAALRYPSVRNLKRLPKSLRQRCRILLPVLRALALLLLIVALARPVRKLETQELPSQGLAIAMLLDRSGSMGDPNGKLMYEKKLELRFKIAQDLFEAFVKGGRGNLQGRPNDLIGLFSFATYPRTDHPFSLDHESIGNMVKQLSFEKPFIDEYGQPTDDIRKAALETDERGRVLRDNWGRPVVKTNPMQLTDLKAAIEYAANKLIMLDEDLARPSAGRRKYEVKSKVLVLLTDGEPTVSGGRRDAEYPDEETMKKLIDAGIRAYFVQILSHQRYRERPDGTIEVIVPGGGGLFGPLVDPREAAAVNKAIDEARKLARRTGGEHFLATSGDQLEAIYERIDALEKSDVGGRAVFSHEERYRPFLGAALALLGVEVLLGLTWLRRLP